MGGVLSKKKRNTAPPVDQAPRGGDAMATSYAVSAEQAAQYAALNGKKRALLCGCNYTGTPAELKGCVNDVLNWYSLLESSFGFPTEEITVLIDEDVEGKNYDKSTGKNIKQHLTRLVEVSKPGDMVFFQFSGHGVQVPADDDDDDYEPDGLDEALCPTDMNLIVDDDLRDILSGLVDGVKFTMVSDCCHSGGMLDHKEVIIDGEADDDVKTFSDPHKAREIFLSDLNVDTEKKDDISFKNRAIDVSTMEAVLRDMAKEQDGSEKIDVAAQRMRGTLFALYGNDASNAATHKINHVGQYAGAGKKPESGLIRPDKGILITGCQAHETSADVTGKDGRAFGALSHTVTKIVRRHREKYPDKPITCRQLVLKVRKLLNNSGFEQNPCLECSDSNADANFIVW
ncbi:hypothetical protein BSKO_07103 [Bryopsis sp. KO-2023]|nr:hypothetical protein BSKO_07103 [Bryopsis sp. KO-2023]